MRHKAENVEEKAKIPKCKDKKGMDHPKTLEKKGTKMNLKTKIQKD